MRSTALSALKKMLANPVAIGEFRKSWTQPSTSTTGIQNYNLEAPSKKFIPVYTPMRNQLPRYKVTGGNAINWRAVTAINVNNTSPGVSEGNRNAFLNSTTKEYTRKFAGLGHEDYVTFEADMAAEGFEDLRAMAMENLLDATYISEEFVIIGGHGSGSYTLGAPTGFAITDAGVVTGSAMTGRSIFGCVVPLTVEAMRFISYTGPVVDSTVQVVDTTTRTNADGSVDMINGGHGAYSALLGAAVAITAGHGATLKCDAVRGAYGYAWFIGTVNAYASLKLAYVSTVNKVTLAADENAGAQVATAFSTDKSNNGLVFDGFLSLVADSTSGGVWKSLDGATLTANQDGTMKEIDAICKTMWDKSRCSVDEIWANLQQILDMTQKALAGGSTTAYRITIAPGTDMASLTVGTIVGEYRMKTGGYDGGKVVPIRLHPNVPEGTLLGLSKTLPYKSNNVPAVARMAVRKEYYGQDWPLKSRKYEHGVYVDELLQLYAAFACWILTNIGNG